MKQELGNLMAEDPQQETINLLNYRLNAVTVERNRLDDQLDEILLRLGKTQERMFDAERQRDRLAEACKLLMAIVGEPNSSVDSCWASEDEMDAAWNMGKEALQSLNQN